MIIRLSMQALSVYWKLACLRKWGTSLLDGNRPEPNI